MGTVVSADVSTLQVLDIDPKTIKPYQKELEKQLNILGIMKPYLGKAEELRSFENLNLYYKINSTLSELLLKFIYPPQIYFPY